MSVTHFDLRRQFTTFFEQRGHTAVKSSPLVPQGDNSLMFVNAGMVQFKDLFLGQEERSYSRAVSCQKCMRVSGKHNDLEEVGRTARHHTLFEMLGNFSFGDYFKEEAIAYAWEFIHHTLGISKERLYITVFAGEAGLPPDNEARSLWQRISGLPSDHIQGRGSADNFWSMGDMGPCGPCTEIHVDRGQGPVSLADFENGRVTEIWNNVFMQYSRDATGKLTALPKASVDTGMGLERVLALLNGADSNYHTDSFMPLIDTVAQASGKPYSRSDTEDDVSMRVIADHARALTFLVADGVQPSNDGRGYVLRRIVRRAIRHGRRLGLEKLFLAEVCHRVVKEMSGAYPELAAAQSLIGKVADQEEESFRRTLDGGLKILGDALGASLSRVARANRPTLAGDVVFKLYDTYGFPKDLTETIAQEQGLAIDHAGFDALMAAQQERSRGSSGAHQAASTAVWRGLTRAHGATNFIGYPNERLALSERPGTWREKEGRLEATCEILGLVAPGLNTEGPTLLQRVDVGQEVDVVLGPMPLYGEGGGQVGDTGFITDDQGLLATVRQCWRPVPDLMVARVQVQSGYLSLNQQVWAGYGISQRLQVRAHHSATHLLHGALRAVLGEHIKQAGSLVTPTHLRFDFTHFAALSPKELLAVEAHVNERITKASEVTVEELAFDDAQAKGAIALFGEKYGERVRVITMDDSVELCGGTHAANTADLGLFMVMRESAVQAGVRRVEAEVSQAAVDKVLAMRTGLAQIACMLGANHLATTLMPNSAVASQTQQISQPVQALQRALSQLDEAKALLADQAEAFGLNAQALGLTQVTLPSPDKPLSLAHAQQLRDTWRTIVGLLQARPQEQQELLAALQDRDMGHLAAGVLSVLVAVRKSQRLASDFHAKGQAQGAGALAQQARVLKNGVRLVTHVLAPDEGGDLKDLADHVRQSLGSGVVVLIVADRDRVTLLIALTSDLSKSLSAGKLVAQVAPIVGGRGGGRPDLAQAGGRDPSGIPEAIRKLEALISAADVAPSQSSTKAT